MSLEMTIISRRCHTHTLWYVVLHGLKLSPYTRRRRRSNPGLFWDHYGWNEINLLTILLLIPLTVLPTVCAFDLLFVKNSNEFSYLYQRSHRLHIIKIGTGFSLPLKFTYKRTRFPYRTTVMVRWKCTKIIRFFSTSNIEWEN